MTRHPLRTLFFLFIFGFSLLLPASVWARIDITPTRIFLGPRDRGAEITILNLLNTPGTIRVDIVNNKLTAAGTYQKSETPVDPRFDPQKYIRISPRQFTLPAGGRQKIRINVQRAADLPAGSYHFHVKALRLARFDETTPSTVGEEGRLAVYTSVGIAIPVIVNHGEVKTAAKITEPKIVQGAQGPEIQAKLTRTGDGNIIGIFQVLWEPAGGEVRQIALHSNVNLFTELESRDVSIPLRLNPQGQGQIRLVYLDELQNTKVDEVTLPR